MIKKHPLIKGTLILTIASLLSRILGFYNRIFLSRTIGARELGIYQMIFPVYLLCFSICCHGFETALSRLIAAEVSASHDQNILFLLKSAIGTCLLLALLCTGVLYYGADAICIHFFTSKGASCLKMTAFALPFVAIKGCIVGYYIGTGNSSIPSVCQICEQLFRVGSILLFAYSSLYSFVAGAKLAACGMVIGECASCLLILYFFTKASFSDSPDFIPKKKLYLSFWKLSLPLTANRISLSLLQSIEAVLIPRQLSLYYGNTAFAIELYGVLTGIALPFLFFPSTLTHSLATVLLPSVASDYESKNTVHLNRTITIASYGCFLLGVFFLGIFFFGSDFFGTVIFHNEMSVSLIRILSFLCPAFYLSAIQGSILNGFGKTAVTFRHNLYSILLRLLFILFAIPAMGIHGYLFGLLCSCFFLVFCHNRAIHKITSWK